MEVREVPDLARKLATQFRKDQHGLGPIQNWLYPSQSGRRHEIRHFKGALVEDTRGRGEDRNRWQTGSQCGKVLADSGRSLGDCYSN